MVAAASVAVLVYLNALSNGFVLDDGGVIVRNPLVTSPLGAWRAFGLPYWPETLGGGQYRPLGILTFALDWLVSGGDARWFHAMNIALAPDRDGARLDVGRGAARARCRWNRGARRSPFTPCTSRPWRTSSDASNRWQRRSCSRRYCCTDARVVSRRSVFALALLSKESAIVLLALAAANDVILERDWRATFRARRWLYAGYGAVTLVYVVVLAVVFHARALSIPARAFAGTTTWQRLEIVGASRPALRAAARRSAGPFGELRA